MTVDDAIALVTKMTFGPRDVLVVTVAPTADFRVIAEAVTARRHEIPRLKDVPVLVTREDIAAIEKLDDAAARELYAALRTRFEGGK